MKQLKKYIYLDYAATTPVDPKVAKVMAECLTIEGNFGNPASNTYYLGWQAKESVDRARRQIANLIGADSREIVFTSGATESDNLAIKGIAEAYQSKGKHIVTCATEHKAVLDTCIYLESKGFTVTYLKPSGDGLFSKDQLEQAITEQTILVSVMAVNNEIGVVQPIAEMGALCKRKKIPFHVDAAQAVGKIPINVKEMNIDLLSLSAHKLYGPKGIGILYVRRKPRLKLTPLIHGGKHENGFRSGTLAVHQIVGLGEAAEIANNILQQEMEKIVSLRNKLYSELRKIPDVVLNGNINHLIPGILNITVKGVDGEALIMALSPLAVSAGSACNSALISPSHVLEAMGVSAVDAHSTVRISIGRFTSNEDIDSAIAIIIKAINQLRNLSPLYNTAVETK